MNLRNKLFGFLMEKNLKELLRTTLSFINILFKNSPFLKHFDLTLDIRPNFLENIKVISKKNSKTLAPLRKFQPIFAKSYLFVMYKKL